MPCPLVVPKQFQSNCLGNELGIQANHNHVKEIINFLYSVQTGTCTESIFQSLKTLDQWTSYVFLAVYDM